jgi:hypothetical protein
MKRAIVITTINHETQGVEEFSKKDDWDLLVVGDEKSKNIETTDRLKFLSVNNQKQLGYQFVEKCPYNHYGRKNIGYLYAAQNGAKVIYDTDDDNIPYPEWFAPEFCANNVLCSQQSFVNIYSRFGVEDVWPRGFPLDEIKSNKDEWEEERAVNIGVWQGLADKDPDVDAIYRLLNNNEISFSKREPIALDKGVYAPLNSQNTFWHRSVFPLMYLPLTVSFRFTDILRGYIAQRIMWEYDKKLGVMGATVYQVRNDHDLMKDFEDEIECYLKTKNIVSILSEIKLSADIYHNIIVVYQSLVDGGLIDHREMDILKAWVNDLMRYI